MESAPLLFDLGPPKPTTRQVADLIRSGGMEALTDAERRADAATYQEVRCRSALNPVKGMPFDWTLNPYRGCTHGCHYCYARRYHTQFELDAGDQFASVIFVKTNLVDVLKRELARPAWTRPLVALGTATDCYQPIEGHYKLTRRALEVFSEWRNPVSIVTKGPMVVRDTDVLQSFAGRADCSVYISIPCVDEAVSDALEPGTAPPLKRLRALRHLVDAGIHAGVLMSPIVPGISSKPALIERTVKAVADHGACFIGSNVMYLQDGTRDHFMRWLAQSHPELLEAYARLYPAKYPLSEYRGEVRNAVAAAKARHGYAPTAARRESRSREPKPAGPTAPGLLLETAPAPEESGRPRSRKKGMPD
jgi:DNA repair photolyase